ncbi:UDP-N-acetylglucosamine-peptide N-acetylglucosaminyltransferase [Rothia sp. HMSC069C01]|uniref:tetratricopeptide repeat protein n=1 Tax=Rothia sp. HMSC069C01 TaxID=1739485 RepID=UPI0008CB57E5|nr:tetratricopeptide repeat protein [Rothia sp. HMSC069C01]OFP56136.1 UDP-N-acetylglucosamine-peptide N-acetylglucosaminyltransferase [Rothia sp. HMSC069C01]
MTEPNKPHEPMSTLERLGLGMSYLEQGRFDEAINVWSRIRREDNPEIYAGAQLNLGLIYKDIGDLKTATIAWSNIRYEDNPEAYAGAQLCFGMVYQCEGNLENAIAAWSNVRRKDSSTTYAQSQLNIGLAYKELGNLDSAITAWSNVHRNDGPEVYAWAQLGLGLAYKELGNLDSAITAWSNVHRNDDPEVYAKAQFNLGTAHKENPENLEDAITAWSNVHRNDDPEVYAKAQFNLGTAHKENPENLEDAITAWSNIRCEDNPELYAVAQFTLGDVFTQRGNYKQGKEAYRNARNLLYYESERARRILDCPKSLYKKLHELAANTDKILTSLQIDLDFESKVSHYSRASTAFNLFGDEKNNEKPSNFRLSTIRGVNDPTEGLILGKYWDQQGISETIHINKTATFISCFTFNHDSLNQFRLYGKEDGLEATGISLVFNKDFFNIHLDHLGFITNPSSDNASLMEEPNKTSKTKKQPKKNDKTFFVEKCKLYRCIYLDPETGYLTLARRDKSTFYRNNRRKAEEEWEKYQDLILEKEKNFKKYLFDDNTSILRILEKVFSKDFSYTEEEKQQILKTVRFILLPLQYLVKHIAFQEEQECRIMYITHLHDEKIRHDWEKQWMYVEYEEPVLPHIDEVYLSPGAAKYQDHFRILLDRNGKESKVRISQNPFRNKE